MTAEQFRGCHLSCTQLSDKGAESAYLMIATTNSSRSGTSLSFALSSLVFLFGFGAQGWKTMRAAPSILRAAPRQNPIPYRLKRPRTRTSPSHRSTLPSNETPKWLEILIQRTAQENDLDPQLIKAVIAAESQFDVYNVSPKGACGLMQLLPSTAHLLAVKDIFDPEENVSAGAKHLSYLLKRFSNDLPLTLAAYNAGEKPVLLYKSIPPYPETQHYVQRVLELYQTYKS